MQKHSFYPSGMDFRSIRSRLIYSALSVAYGQKLIKNMGIYAASRYLRNIGCPIEYALELLAVRACAK